MPETSSIASAVLDAARNRGRLALTESKLALKELLGIASALAAALFLALLFGVGLTFAFAAFVWDMDHRVAFLLGLAALYAIGATISLTWAISRFKKWRLLQATSAQLGEDCEALQKYFKGHP